MKPKFVHDCDKCRFHGHYFGHDIYSCGHGSKYSHSLIARWGDEGSQYASTMLYLFREGISNPNELIMIDGKTVPYQEFVLSPTSTYHKAWMLVLAIDPELKGTPRG